MYASINSTLISADNVFISAVGEGVAYGYGLFETLKIVNGTIIFMEEHFNRLRKGCTELGLHFNYDLKNLQKYAEELIRLNSIFFGSLKILYLKNKNQYDLLITTNENIYTVEKYMKGFHICIASAKRNPHSKLTYIKSNNYLENLMEKANANMKGFDEAIYFNVDDNLSEGSYTNIFFVRDNTVYTPSISCGLLPGIMRDKVIDLINKLSIKLEIGQFHKEDLLGAEEIFLTNSLMEIMPVTKLEEKIFRLECNGLTKRLRSNFDKLPSI